MSPMFPRHEYASKCRGDYRVGNIGGTEPPGSWADRAGDPPLAEAPPPPRLSDGSPRPGTGAPYTLLRPQGLLARG